MAESFEYFTSKMSSMEEDADILWYLEILVFVICSFYLHIVHTMHILHVYLEPILQPSYAARCSHCTVHCSWWYCSLPTMPKHILQVKMPHVKTYEADFWICMKYAIYMQDICKTYAGNMQEICTKYAINRLIQCIYMPEYAWNMQENKIKICKKDARKMQERYINMMMICNDMCKYA